MKPTLVLCALLLALAPTSAAFGQEGGGGGGGGGGDDGGSTPEKVEPKEKAPSWKSGNLFHVGGVLGGTPISGAFVPRVLVGASVYKPGVYAAFRFDAGAFGGEPTVQLAGTVGAHAPSPGFHGRFGFRFGFGAVGTSPELLTLLAGQFGFIVKHPEIGAGFGFFFEPTVFLFPTLETAEPGLFISLHGVFGG